MIAAILRAQWLSMRLGGSRGRILGLITGILWYGFWCAVSYFVYSLARVGDAAGLRTGVPAALLAIGFYWQLVPVMSGSLGSALDLRKLLIYPAPHDTLFLVEVLLRLTTGAEMVLVLLGGTVGLLRNRAAGGWAAAPRMGLAILIYILFNLLLASGLRSLLERLLSRRHIRELLVFIMLLAVTAPRLLILTGVGPRSAPWLTPLIHTAVLPWAAVGGTILGESLSFSLLVMLAWTAAAAWFGRTEFERNLKYDAMAAQATPLRMRPHESSWSERFFRLPSLLFRDPLAALIEKELRSLARTPRFRMVFVMGFSFGLVVWLPFILGRQANRGGPVGQNFLVIVCVYALTLLGQVSYWNSFGFDRSAAQIYFTAPQPISLALAAKNIASLLFIYVEVVVLTGITLALRIGVSLGKVFETLLVVGVCALYMLALGNISSVQYPRPLKPERVAQGGAGSRFQGLIFIVYPLTLLPVFLAYLARYAFQSQLAFSLILAVAAAIGAVFYWIAMDSAVNSALTHRERMIEELSRSEGPIAAG